MTKPILSDPYVSAWKMVNDTRSKPINATTFSVNCTVGYEQQVIDDGARFEVSFQTDEGFTLYNVTLQSTSVMVVTLRENKLAGHLGKMVIKYCNNQYFKTLCLHLYLYFF